ncbi:hypothetical protein CBS101457_001632 [Exobasidium rhododendri]|nr:hypothetical protein CBS101457_001632 [Exobasidium rhododendri]
MATATTSRVAASAPADGTQLTYNETIEVLCGFGKSAILSELIEREQGLRQWHLHCIYQSRLPYIQYSAIVKSTLLRYRVPVWASRHPGLTSYIDEVLSAAKVQMEKSILRSIHLVLTSISSGQILERYRFDILVLLDNVPPRDRNLSIPGNMTMETIELHLRAFMMKLISLDGALDDIENVEDVTWAVVLDMKDGEEPQTDDKSGDEPSQGPWVPFKELHGRRASGQTDENAKSQERSEDGEPLVLPVKSLDTGVINLMLYVEENPAAKRASQEETSSLKGRTKSQRRSTQQLNPIDVSIQVGERDIDAPLPRPSSSGAPTSRNTKQKKRQKGKDGQAEEVVEDVDSGSDVDSIDTSGSGGSIQSVNDFAGYGSGKGLGSIGTNSASGW